ncbi:MAG: hypothetical protein AB7H77_11995 [Bdellovibrionales bacterium]
MARADYEKVRQAVGPESLPRFEDLSPQQRAGLAEALAFYNTFPKLTDSLFVNECTYAKRCEGVKQCLTPEPAQP